MKVKAIEPAPKGRNRYWALDALDVHGRRKPLLYIAWSAHKARESAEKRNDIDRILLAVELTKEEYTSAVARLGRSSKHDTRAAHV